MSQNVEGSKNMNMRGETKDTTKKENGLSKKKTNMTTISKSNELKGKS